jgi:spermidine synthase
MSAPGWVDETYDDVITRYRVRDTIFKGKTPFQDVLIVDTNAHGRMLLLDGVVQTTEADEFVYHEMMTHVPMLAHPGPERALVVGGGDGGILREVLRHPGVKQAVLVEIDEQVIELCRQHMPMISKGSLDDPRVRIVVDDGAKFVAETDEQFDVVVVDSPDPVGPAKVLFSREFYENLQRVLAPCGFLSRQTGVAFLACKELKDAYGLARELFSHCMPYLFTVPTYVGGPFSSLLCANEEAALPGPEEIEQRFSAAGLVTRYYSPAVHTAAFQLPPFVQEVLEA